MGIVGDVIVKPLAALAGDVPLWIFVPVFVTSLVSLAIAINVLGQLLFVDKSKPPMVFHWAPFIGSTIEYGMDPYKFFDKNRKKHGDVFTFILLGRNVTVCLGPKGNELVLNSKHANVSAEEAYHALTAPVFGEGVVYDCPNSRLMEQKKFAKSALTKEAFKKNVPEIAEEFNEYLNRSGLFFGDNQKDRKSGTVPLMQALPELTIFTASRCLQGKETRKHFDETFAQLYSDLDHGFTPLNFLFENLPLPSFWRRDRAQKIVSDTYLKVIKERRKDSGVEHHDLIDALMRNATYKDGVTMTDRQIANLNIGILMGGQHTSSATSTWAMLHLGASPELQEELFEEQKRAVGGDINAPLTYEALQEMPLINNVIRETLRMHPPLHSIMRYVKNDLQVAGSNIVIPHGNYVLASPGVSSIDEQFFPHAKEFDIARWDDNKKMSNESDDDKVDYGYGLVSKGASSPYLPFGAGRHRCIGEQFAYMQIGTILSYFIRTFKWQLPGGSRVVPPPDYSSMVVLPAIPGAIEWQIRESVKK